MLVENMRLATGDGTGSQGWARLAGYARVRVGRECLPGIVAEDNAFTEGIVYDGVDGEGLGRIDHWLGAEFQRTRVRVRVGDSKILSAITHELVDGYCGQLAREPWEVELLMRVFSQADTELGTGAILLEKLRAC